MLENRGREGEPPLFLLPGEERERERERAISTALQTSSAVSFRSSPSAFSFHKLVRLDSDPMERSIHRGTISISPGSSQRSAFRVLSPSLRGRGRFGFF